MRKLSVFIQVSLDGFFADAKGDMSWAHKAKEDAEWSAFVASNAQSGSVLLFGRVTYQMMESYWPTPMAAQNAPEVAEGMNRSPKVVFSRTLDKAAWSNTRLVKTGMADEVRKMKSEPGPDMAILGSGSLVSQLTAEGLIDEFKIVINPIVLGKGKTLFETVKDKVTLKRTKTQAFGNGDVLICYEPLSRAK
jgi:dihydrofolate reductase